MCETRNDRSKEPKFKSFTVDPNFSTTRSLDQRVDSFFKDYINVEIISTAQSQANGFVTLSVFFKGERITPEE